MAVYGSEAPDDRVRQRRIKSEQAIGLAAKGRWEEAAGINREILELFPSDVDASNRLGKAFMELGRYAEARESYSRALKTDPMNSIAAKNLQRLAKLVEEGAAAPPPAVVDPRLFIEESGKTTVSHLTGIKRSDAVAKLAAGDELKIEQRGAQIIIRDGAGEEIGRIEPKLEQGLIRLLSLGNRYVAFVTAANDQAVSVIIRETYRSPAMGNRPSFRPSAAVEATRAYTREGLLRYELEEEEEEEEFLEEEEEEEEGGATLPTAEGEPVAERGEEVPTIEALAEAEEEEPEEAE